MTTAPATGAWPARSKLGVLAVLYFVQGLPYGFQLTALPIYLREAGVSLTGIGLASVLSLPWLLKVVWGPLVDGHGSKRFGRRRGWILPLQGGLLVACIVAAFVPPDSGLGVLLVMVLLMNLFAATMDVAVDGLAVDLLRPHELGYGNIAQVVGYKIGILTGGGLLVWASARIGWQGLFLTVAVLVALGIVVTATMREPAPAGQGAEGAPRRVRDAFALLVRAVRLPGTGWLIAFIATYKLGESMADTMFKPFLYDAGFDRAQIGLWVGTWGMVFSLVGSFLGGVAASRMPMLRAVALAAVLRALAVGGEWWLSLVEPTTGRVIGVIAVESFFGGALTTAMFAYMMSRVDRRIGASHYTLLATIEVLGKMVAAQISGIVADQTSYATLFALATVLAFAFLGLLIPILREARKRERSDTSPAVAQQPAR